MIAIAALLGAIAFAETQPLAVQIGMDRARCSCNTIDGVWGAKSASAARAFLAIAGCPAGGKVAPGLLYTNFFQSAAISCRIATVREDDLAALVKIPASPAGKAALPHMGYESIKEMFAERGHLSLRAIERLNANIDWNRVRAGDRIRIPDFPPMEEEFKVWPKGRPGAPKRPEAALLRISLKRFELAAYDRHGALIALFPCSIAKDKAKLPPRGELKITETIAMPNYTYKDEKAAKDGKARRYIFPPGPNSPVGVAWLGLDLPGYGIHGTPSPESVGRAESHGCFRLANWNAARLYGLCRPGTRVIIAD